VAKQLALAARLMESWRIPGDINWVLRSTVTPTTSRSKRGVYIELGIVGGAAIAVVKFLHSGHPE
jgi:hypothetical protein